MCVLGKRLVKDISIENCNKTIGGPLHELFCHNTTSCDPYYDTHNVSIVKGIKGLASGVFMGMFTNKSHFFTSHLLLITFYIIYIHI